MAGKGLDSRVQARCPTAVEDSQWAEEEFGSLGVGWVL